MQISKKPILTRLVLRPALHFQAMEKTSQRPWPILKKPPFQLDVVQSEKGYKVDY